MIAPVLCASRNTPSVELLGEPKLPAVCVDAAEFLHGTASNVHLLAISHSPALYLHTVARITQTLVTGAALATGGLNPHRTVHRVFAFGVASIH